MIRQMQKMKVWACGLLLGAGVLTATVKCEAQGQGKLAAAPPVTYDNRYEVYAGINYQNDQAGPALPKLVNLAGIEALGTVWMTGHLGIGADFRGEAGTTNVFPNSQAGKPLIALYTGMLGAEWRGPRGQRAAMTYHAFGGVSHGSFNINDRTDESIGLYSDRTKPFVAVGAGFDFNRSKKWAIRASPDLILEHFGSNWKDFFSVSGGVVYRIGKRK
jgi:hypothetical protein